jgi:hypothetical protein
MSTATTRCQQLKVTRLPRFPIILWLLLIRLQRIPVWSALYMFEDCCIEALMRTLYLTWINDQHKHSTLTSLSRGCVKCKRSSRVKMGHRVKRSMKMGLILWATSLAVSVSSIKQHMHGTEVKNAKGVGGGYLRAWSLILGYDLWTCRRCRGDVCTN